MPTLTCESSKFAVESMNEPHEISNPRVTAPIPTSRRYPFTQAYRLNIMHTERHKAGYEYEALFPDISTYAAYEGGTVFLAGQLSPCHVIIDESTSADLMDEEDELIVIHTFDDPA